MNSNKNFSSWGEILGDSIIGTLSWTGKERKGPLAKVGLDYCDQLFALEREWAELPWKERHKARNEHARKILDEYFS